jgi:hypothetical protein
LLYFDNFSKSNSGWFEGDVGSALYEYRGGEYRILVRNSNWWAGVSPGFSFTDYLVSVEVRSINTNYGGHGLMFGLASDYSTFYTFEVDILGNYYVLRRNNDGSWTELATGFSSAVNLGTNTNKLAVERNGTKINVFANSVLLASVSDGSNTGSLFNGIIARNVSTGNFDARFDNFKVQPIGCGLSIGAAAAPALTSAYSISDVEPIAIPWAHGPLSSDGSEGLRYLP